MAWLIIEAEASKIQAASGVLSELDLPTHCDDDAEPEGSDTEQ